MENKFFIIARYSEERERKREKRNWWLDNFYDQAMFRSPIFVTNLSAAMSRREAARERREKAEKRGVVLLVS